MKDKELALSTVSLECENPSQEERGVCDCDCSSDCACHAGPRNEKKGLKKVVFDSQGNCIWSAIVSR